MTSVHPFLDEPGPVPIAHRGGSAVWPQNTMAAFEGAVGLGYRYLETDVQATSDGVLAVFHDDELAPTSDRGGRISEMSWAEVSQARVEGEPIPRLEELLDAFDDVRISIDPKTDAAVEPLIEALRRPGVLERVCIGSFSDERLERVDEAHGDAACLSFSPREIARLRMLSLAGLPARPRRSARSGSPSHRRRERPFRGRIASIPLRRGPIPLATRRLVDYAHRAGLAVHVWTIDDPVEMDRLLDIGVDGVMTDEPKVLLEVMTERGAWPAGGEAVT
ncbi:glycerophosphodiester phosphodiesterase [Candidatus Poriferisodalis sp.]|uniref:glycerophosphodiester phosphodiesterase n=1 Tax=Candidatus Poriferisodalis sp. TaxID=3101277 RepID=UPI003B0160F9